MTHVTLQEAPTASGTPATTPAPTRLTLEMLERALTSPDATESDGFIALRDRYQSALLRARILDRLDQALCKADTTAEILRLVSVTLRVMNDPFGKAPLRAPSPGAAGGGVPSHRGTEGGAARPSTQPVPTSNHASDVPSVAPLTHPRGTGPVSTRPPSSNDQPLSTAPTNPGSVLSPAIDCPQARIETAPGITTIRVGTPYDSATSPGAACAQPVEPSPQSHPPFA